VEYTGMPNLTSLSRTDTHTPECTDTVARETRRLLANSAIELSANGESTIRRAAKSLVPGTTVFVPKMPTQSLEAKLEQIRTLKDVGLNPVPHIVARQITSERVLSDFLEQAVSVGGVHHVLVVGGDGFNPEGPFQDAAAVIASGVLRDAGITKVGVGGYPDGHPDIAAEELRGDLERKLALTREQGLALSVVTQFSFEPRRIAEYCQDLSNWVPGVPVYAGLAGPTSPKQLLRFAKICGVSMSIRGANKLGLSAFRLAANSGPDKQVGVLAERGAEQTAGNLEGIHLFSFGGFVESSEWLSAKRNASGLA
jgi:methylenetetrahydrofolate reductase (NADPH)